MRHRGLLLMFALALGANASVAEAVVGAIRFTISVPFDAPCGESFGTALALVPGGKAGFPQSPALLVTSCVRCTGGGRAIDLFLTDPFGGDGSALQVKPLVTGFPSTATAATMTTAGWQAIVLRA